MTWPRWIFTVILLTPISPATCLFISPGRDQGHHLKLTRCKRLQLGFQLGHAFISLPPLAIALQCVGDGVKQVLVAERLGQEIDRARFHGPHRHGDVAMRGDEDDGYLNIGFDQLALKIEAASLWQPDVEHEAAGNFRQRGLQHFRRRSEDFDAQADRAKETAQGFAEGGVVVDHQDDRVVRRRRLARCRGAPCHVAASC
jgi:hypothetical protein